MCPVSAVADPDIRLGGHIMWRIHGNSGMGNLICFPVSRIYFSSVGTKVNSLTG